MNLSLGLRQIFSYLLPGAVSLFILGIVWIVCFQETAGLESKDGEWWGSLAKAIGDTSLLGGLVFVLFSIALGILSSSWFAFFLKLVSRVYGDPRLSSFEKLPQEIQQIVRQAGGKANHALFYYCWAVVKLKVDKPLEFALFGIYAMNFCARVLGIVLISTIVVLTSLVISGFGGRFHSEAAILAVLLILSGLLLLRSMSHFLTLWCSFGMSLFTAVFQLDLSREQRDSICEQVLSLVVENNKPPIGDNIKAKQEN